MAEKLSDQEFLETVVKSIVDTPEKVEIKRTIDERGVLIELKVDASDMGTLIGKDGRTAKALRTLLRVVGSKNNARVNLKIIEPEGGRRSETAESEKKEDSNDAVADAMEDLPQDTIA